MTSKLCAKCMVSKPLSAFGGHIYCRDCYNAWRKVWRKNNQDKMKAQKERALARKPDRFKEADRKSYWLHREQRIAKSRRWNVENKERFAAREASRRAAQKAATPKWIDWSALEMVYAKAAELTTTTGVLHHVDHIVPLKSKKVCGLHVPWNLQVLTAFENQSKNNRYWPDMP